MADRNTPGVHLTGEAIDMVGAKEINLVEATFAAEINQLDKSSKGGLPCYALNDHFADRFGLSPSRSGAIISQLLSKMIIERLLVRDHKKVFKARYLRVIAPALITVRARTSRPELSRFQSVTDPRNWDGILPPPESETPPPENEGTLPSVLGGPSSQIQGDNIEERIKNKEMGERDEKSPEINLPVDLVSIYEKMEPEAQPVMLKLVVRNMIRLGERRVECKAQGVEFSEVVDSFCHAMVIKEEADRPAGYIRNRFKGWMNLYLENRKSKSATSKKSNGRSNQKARQHAADKPKQTEIDFNY